eukprot:TRINITY_DN13543_c0_g1_i3.p1 TRINITY_DN13543_c0_g1~~TRINITY_DN13543_c0_g1_i3.p1  ORF type:complete len:586 (+),score=134.95 TRINITY_DN13543_c0_g1_i3:220-1977(+)
MHCLEDAPVRTMHSTLWRPTCPGAPLPPPDHPINWIHLALQTISTHPTALSALFQTSSNQLPHGKELSIALFINGDRQLVQIDASVPVHPDGSPGFASSTCSDECWVALAEKAVVQHLHGSYRKAYDWASFTQTTNESRFCELVSMLSGGYCFSIPMELPPVLDAVGSGVFWEWLSVSVAGGQTSASCWLLSTEGEQRGSCGQELNRAYPIIEVNLDSQMVALRRPLAPGEEDCGHDGQELVWVEMGELLQSCGCVGIVAHPDPKWSSLANLQIGPATSNSNKEIIISSQTSTPTCVSVTTHCHDSIDHPRGFSLAVLPLDGEPEIASSPLSLGGWLGAVVWLEADVRYSLSVHGGPGQCFQLKIDSQHPVCLDGPHQLGRKKTRNFPSQFAQGMREEQQKHGRQNPRSFVEQMRAQKERGWEGLVQLCMLSWDLPSARPSSPDLSPGPSPHARETQHISPQSASVALAVLQSALLQTCIRSEEQLVGMSLPTHTFFQRVEEAEQQFDPTFLASTNGHEVLCLFRSALEFDYEGDAVGFGGALEMLEELARPTNNTASAAQDEDEDKALPASKPVTRREPTPVVL